MQSESVVSRKITIQLLYQVALLLMVATVGCSKRFSDVPAFSPLPFHDYANQSVGRFKSSYIIDQIDSYYKGVDPGPIGVTTLVNIDDLYSTSTFGRVFAEQMMSELSMHGYDVIELRQGEALQFLAPDGEFALSRHTNAIRPVRELGAVVVGTYAISPVRVYINVRLIEPSTSRVLSAGSVEMRKTTELARLLKHGSLSATLERIPVRRLGFETFPENLRSKTEARYDLEERDDFLVKEPMLPTSPPEKMPAMHKEAAKSERKGK